MAPFVAPALSGDEWEERFVDGALEVCAGEKAAVPLYLTARLLPTQSLDI
ncbi:hypothetical protein [Nocardia sp. NPDC049526]